MTKLTIAEALRDVVLEHAAETKTPASRAHIWKGDPDLLHEAYDRAGRKQSHPLNTLDSVIAAARRSPLFEHAGYIRAHTMIGADRQVLYAAFKLRDSTAAPGGITRNGAPRHE